MTTATRAEPRHKTPQSKRGATGLRRELGLGGLSFYGIGLILGAGIYSILGSAAAETGEALWMAFLIGSVAALLTGLSYAELSTMLPHAGAEYVYVAEAWPRARWLRAMLGFTMTAAGSATAATVALAFAGYAQLFLTAPEWLIAGLLLSAATGLNTLGVKESSVANTVFTATEAIALIALVAVGTQDTDFGEALTATPHAGVLAGAGLVFFAYLGFEDIANLAEETRDPGKNLPRAILLAVAFSGCLYILVALASVALLPPEELSGSSSPLADAMRAGSPRLAGALGGVALFATANTALIALLAVSRVLFGMAQGGDAPKPLGRVLPGRGVPWLASLAALGAAGVLLPLGEVDIVGSVASLAALLAFVVVNACLVRLRFRQPDAERPFRVPGAIAGVPLLPCLGAIVALMLMTQFEPLAYVIVLAVLAGALLLHHLRRRVAE